MKMQKKIIAVAVMLVNTGFAVAGDISGGWDVYRVGYETLPQRMPENDKKMIGAMEFKRNKDGSYTGDLIFGQAHETCLVKPSGKKWNIRCKLVEPIPNWSPDNFVLEEVDGNKMTGNLFSNQSFLVDFIRQ